MGYNKLLVIITAAVLLIPQDALCLRPMVTAKKVQCTRSFTNGERILLYGRYADYRQDEVSDIDLVFVKSDGTQTISFPERIESFLWAKLQVKNHPPIDSGLIPVTGFEPDDFVMAKFHGTYFLIQSHVWLIEAGQIRVINLNDYKTAIAYIQTDESGKVVGFDYQEGASVDIVKLITNTSVTENPKAKPPAQGSNSNHTQVESMFLSRTDHIVQAISCAA